jgi:hypothetical protein
MIPEEIARVRAKGLPLSAWLPPDQRKLLAAKRDAQIAEQAKAAEDAAKRRAALRLQGATGNPAPYRADLSPVIRAPSAGQRFPNETAIPIKIAPPAQYAGTETGLDGTPVRTDRSVTGYMVKLERFDPKGNAWVPHTSLPVGASQAESAAGYTGFGAGLPPRGTTTPGNWRISARISAPRESGWSEWVEFVVTPPPSTSSRLLQPPTRAFSR